MSILELRAGGFCYFIFIIQSAANKMSMPDQVLHVLNHKYPFGLSPTSAARVQQVQSFPTVQALLEKRSEMVRKQQMLTSNALIRLQGVCVEGLTLIYEWQFVAHSIGSYVRSRFGAESEEIREMASKLLLKKVTYELTVLMSYLAKMRIETELSLQTLGVTPAEKLKLYLNPRSKMGIRSELFLISNYTQAKERIIRELQAELELIRSDPLNPNFRATRPYFQGKMETGNLAESVISTRSRRETASRPKELKLDGLPIKRKMSIGNFDFGLKQDRGCQKEKQHSPRTPKPHKYSCQYDSSSDLHSSTSYLPSASYAPSGSSDMFSGFDHTQQPLLGHSKSIKIELEQKQDMSGRRKRKDSYKVKITTYREYEVEDPSVFKANGADNQEDIFQYFARQARREEAEEQGRKDEQPSTPTRQQNYSPRKGSGKQGLNTTAPSSPPMSPLISPSGPSKNLQERVRQARERSQRVLNKMKFFKK